MIEASSVTSPSASGNPPQPTLSTDVSSSQWMIPDSTASSAAPPLASNPQATSLADIPKGHVEITTGTCSFCASLIDVVRHLKTQRLTAETRRKHKRFVVTDEHGWTRMKKCE